MRHEHIALLILAALAIVYIVWQSGRFQAEGYSAQVNDAALVCYWAPQPPPGIVPTRPDPAGVKHTDGPRFSDVMAPFHTTSPMIQEKTNKTLLLESAPQGISSDVDRKAYVESTVAPPQQILGTLALAPTPPVPTHMPTTLETTVVPESSMSPPTPPVTSVPAPEPATMMPMPVSSVTTEPQPTFAPTATQPATIVA